MSHDMVYNITLGAMWGAMVLNIVLSRRSIREIRRNREMREVIWAYEKELRERGVTLPARCPFCMQVLPRHVENCVLADIPHRIRMTFKQEQ